MSREKARLPRLLRGENGRLREAARLHPTALSVEMNLYPLCRARMTLAADDAPVRMHDFVEIYGQNGLLAVFRVTEIAENCGHTREISLNHALDVFADAVLPGEESIQAPVAQVLSRLAAAQTAALDGMAYWQIGTVEDTAEYAFENRYDNALQCLSDLARRETDYYFSFDFSAFPWRLHFLRRNDEVLSEFRMRRNVESCRVTMDDGALCTRLHLSVETAEGETVTETYEDAAGQAQWGIISKTAGVRAADVPDRAAWARRYFARHGQPDVQITVEGEELNRLTGERLDEMHLGRLCRVALAESGAVYSERIVSIRYPDLLRRPERVTVCLADKPPDAAGGWAGLYRRQQTADARMGRAEKSMQVMRTETRNQLTAHDRHITDIGTILHEAGLEIDAHGVWLYASEDGPNYALGASFKVQADNITAEVTRATAAEGTMSSRITQTADAITAEVTRATAAEGTMSSRITQTADAITAEVTRATAAETEAYSRITQTADAITAEVTRATAAEGTMSSRITQTADAITAEVTRATAAEGSLGSRITQTADAINLEVSKKVGNNEIISRINQTAESILIQASKINLSGYVTASQFNALSGSFNNLVSGTTSASKLTASNGNFSNLEITNALTYGGYGDLKKKIINALSSSASGGTITISSTTLDGSAGPSVNFNIADTQYYRNAVASAETDGWNAARAKVAPPSAGTETSFTVDVPSATQGEKQTYTFTIQKGATPGTSGYASVALGQSVVGRISIGDWYSAGYNAGFTAGQTAGEAYGYTQGWNAAEAQYSAASYARKNLNRYGRADMYVKERETYYPAGNHYWYWSGSDGWDTLYTKSSS